MLRSLGILALLAGTAHAEPKLAVESFKLANGMTVVIHEDHQVPQVAIVTWYKVGSRDEKVGKTGFAHLFEHLMFKGSAHVGDGVIDDLTEEAGGGTNGFTNTDATVYTTVSASNFFEQLLYLEADRLAGLTDTLDQAKLDNQREVVRNERRQNYENVPYGIADEKIPEALWPKGHGYHWSTIGYHADLVAASVDDVKDFFKTYYVPSNAVMVIVGDVDTKQARALVEKYFAWIPSTGEPKRPVHPVPAPIAKQVVVDADDDVQVPQIQFVWRGPPRLHKDEPALDLAIDILSQSKSSRIYERLVYRERLAQEAYGGAWEQDLGAQAMFIVTLKPGVDPAKAVAAIDDEVRKLAAKPPTATELERVKNQHEAGVLRGLENFVGRGVALAGWTVYTGKPSWLAEDLARYRAVTPAQVQAAAAKYLTQSSRVLMTISPKKEAAK